MEFGAAYDSAMQSCVFDPLLMNATTFDFKRALSGNHAAAHSPDFDGKPSKAMTAINDGVIPLGPAGGAWSIVRVQMRGA
jgi:CubicO group peptidase (beta-lactamase class C family)